MIVIPAVDIKNGRCVRLLQGRKDSETVFSKDPAAMALKWQDEGAEIIHVVDLDGAFEQEPKNFAAIERIVHAVTADVQVGGGIRSQETVKKYLDMGVKRVVIGTEAVRNPEFVENVCRLYPNQIVLGIDARKGFVAIEGWTETTRRKAVDLARQFEKSGAAGINFTDIHRDGMQTGPNIEETRRLAESVSIPVFASGGVASIEDIRQLLPLEAVGVAGVITGKALYTGTLSLGEAIKISKINAHNFS